MPSDGGESFLEFSKSYWTVSEQNDDQFGFVVGRGEDVPDVVHFGSKLVILQRSYVGI
jgi:hypothetical protein